MSRAQIIEITVSPAGEVTVQTKGFAGPSCREASKFIEEALGERMTERLTGEFYQTHCTRQETQQLT